MILFDCREVSRRVSQGDYETAWWLTRMLVRGHQAMCRHCARYARQMELIALALRDKADRSVDVERLEGLKKRIIARLAG